MLWMQFPRPVAPILVRRTPQSDGVMTFRVLGPHERGRFAPEAWGHLLALADSGAISPVDLEHIIDRAMIQLDGRIALDDLRTLLEGAGLEDQGPGTNVTVH